MTRFRRRITPGLALIVLFGLASSQARAGSLTIVVTAADSASETITGGPLGTVSNGGNTLTVTGIVALNAFLAANGSAVQFSSLGASSNFAPGGGDSTGSFVTQTGALFYNTALAGTGVVSVQVFQSGFVLPSGPTGTMTGAATAQYTAAPAGSSETFSSTYNSTVNAVPLTSTSTGTAQNSYNPKSSTNIPTFVTPFELSNLTTFNILPNPGSSQATDQFAGSTQVNVNSVPEPASIALFLTGNIGLVILSLLRRRGAPGRLFS